jgi:hypothetical protein
LNNRKDERTREAFVQFSGIYFMLREGRKYNFLSTRNFNMKIIGIYDEQEKQHVEFMSIFSSRNTMKWTSSDSHFTSRWLCRQTFFFGFFFMLIFFSLLIFPTQLPFSQVTSIFPTNFLFVCWENRILRGFLARFYYNVDTAAFFLFITAQKYKYKIFIFPKLSYLFTLYIIFVISRKKKKWKKSDVNWWGEEK